MGEPSQPWRGWPGMQTKFLGAPRRQRSPWAELALDPPCPLHLASRWLTCQLHPGHRVNTAAGIATRDTCQKRQTQNKPWQPEAATRGMEISFPCQQTPRSAVGTQLSSAPKWSRLRPCRWQRERPTVAGRGQQSTAAPSFREESPGRLW